MPPGKIDPARIIDARGLYDNGLATQRQLCYALNVSVKSVASIVNRTSYRWVEEQPNWLQHARQNARETVMGTPIRSEAEVEKIRALVVAHGGFIADAFQEYRKDGVVVDFYEFREIAGGIQYPSKVR